MLTPPSAFKILLVDDAPSNLDMLITILGDQFDLSVCTDGHSALEISLNESPDLILLDIVMPHMDGYEVMQHLKNDPRTSLIPVIFLTSKTEPAEIVKGFETGAVDYINKPFNPSELLARVHTHLKLKRYHDLIEGEKQKLKIKNFMLEKDLELARNIQLKLIPQNPPRPELDFIYRAMHSIGGDFLDFFKLKPHQTGIFLSDVSGHGVPAALVTSMLKGFIQEAGDKLLDPAQLLSHLNDRLIDLTAGNFITAFYGIYDFETQILTYCNAGHNAPYFFNSHTLHSLIPPRRSLPLAIYPSDELALLQKSYQNYHYTFPTPLKILFYTDGLTEATSPNEEVFFESQLPALLPQLYTLPHRELLPSLYQELLAFHQSEDFQDDICIVLLTLA